MCRDVCAHKRMQEQYGGHPIKGIVFLLFEAILMISYIKHALLTWCQEWDLVCRNLNLQSWI